MAITAFATLSRSFESEVDELIVVCCGCQRKRVGPLEFVEASGELWQKRDSISHTLCPECANLHYGFSRDRYAEIVCKSATKAS